MNFTLASETPGTLPWIASSAGRAVAIALLGLSLAGCNALTRLSQVGQEPHPRCRLR